MFTPHDTMRIGRIRNPMRVHCRTGCGGNALCLVRPFVKTAPDILQRSGMRAYIVFMAESKAENAQAASSVDTDRAGNASSAKLKGE